MVNSKLANEKMGKKRIKNEMDTKAKSSVEISDPQNVDLKIEPKTQALTKITGQELSILLLILLTFSIVYLLCYAFKIPYGSITHGKTIFTVFLAFNIYAAYIALKAWSNIPLSSLSRDMALMFTLALSGAATGNTMDLILWFTNYCNFKQNLATNMVFIISLILVFPSMHMLSKLCRVKMKKEFLLYFVFFTILFISIPFIMNPSLFKTIGKALNFKEFMFQMIYAIVGGYLGAFSLYIWNKARGEISYAARFMSLGLVITSICCAIYAGLLSQGEPASVAANPINVVLALSYTILGLSIKRIQSVLSRALTIEGKDNSPEVVLTEVWGIESGNQIYSKMEQKIKNAHSKLLQAQADMKAHKKVIKVLEEEVTKRIDAEKDMMLAKHKAEMANNAKSQFLAMMSHELKTPLTAIKGYSQLISSKNSPLIKEVPDKIQELGSHIVQNSDTLQAIIDSILNFAQLESGKFVYQLKEFPLEMLIGEVRQFISYQKENYDCDFIFNVPEKEVLLKSDLMVIRHIIVNLIMNAFKFCKNGKITLELIVDDTALLINVEDTGIGLSRQEMENIFTPFYQTSKGSKRKYGGTGLGLSLVKRFVEELEGTIQVTSEKNVFTKFEVFIPDIVVFDNSSR